MSDINALLADLAEQTARPGDYADLAAAAIRELRAERDAAVAAEREACAKIADDPWEAAKSEFVTPEMMAADIAAAIRARSNP